MAESFCRSSIDISNNNDMQVVDHIKNDPINNIPVVDGPLPHAVGITDSGIDKCDVTFCQSFENEAAQKDLRERLEVVLGKLSNQQHECDDRPSGDSVDVLSKCWTGNIHLNDNIQVSDTPNSTVHSSCVDAPKSNCSETSTYEVSTGGETYGGCDALQISKAVEEVGRYAYISLIAHSLFMLFEYSKWHRTFQEIYIKDLLVHLELPQQMENTLMMVTRGDAKFHSSDPFVSAIKKQSFIEIHGLRVILADLLEFSLRKGCYDARMRVLIKYVGRRLAVRWDTLDDIEDIVVQSFIENQHQPTEDELKETKQRERTRKMKRIALIGLATVGGGTLIGLTGGLAAPFIAAGAGAIIGGAGAAALGSVAGVAIIGSLFGVAGAGLTGYKMNKRVGGLKEFEFESLTSGHALHATLAISGWLSDEQPDFKTAWLGLDNSKEQYVLRYESKYIKEIGEVFDYLVSAGVTAAVQETLKHTLLSGLLAAITWPAALISVAGIIDNPWSVCTQRSVLAGKHLADVLLSRQQGMRPITLIGYSFGARVIFACLQEMAKRKIMYVEHWQAKPMTSLHLSETAMTGKATVVLCRLRDLQQLLSVVQERQLISSTIIAGPSSYLNDCEGIIEDVIMLGAPVSGCVDDWSMFERVVSGRIVNGYCRSDWLLKFMYRAASVQLSTAGLSAVEWPHRLMHNIDLTQVVSGHFDYARKMDTILEVIGIKTKVRVEPGSLDYVRKCSTASNNVVNQSSDKDDKVEVGVDVVKDMQ